MLWYLQIEEIFVQISSCQMRLIEKASGPFNFFNIKEKLMEILPALR